MLKLPLKPLKFKKIKIKRKKANVGTAQKNASPARAQTHTQKTATVQQASRPMQIRPQSQGAQGVSSLQGVPAKRTQSTAVQPSAKTVKVISPAAEIKKAPVKNDKKAKKAAQRRLAAQKKLIAKRKQEEQDLLRKKQAEEAMLAKEKAKRAERARKLAEKREEKIKKDEMKASARQEKAEERRLAKKAREEKIASSRIFIFLKGLYRTSVANTESASEKKRFPFLAVGTIALATVMFMVIISSFMQISQIQADMKDMEATIRELRAEERKLSMELEGKYSSKIESVASDMGLSGTYHKTYYLESETDGNTEESVASDEAENTSTVNSLMSAFSKSFKKFLEFID